MNSKNISVILSANSASFKTQMMQASGSVKGFEDAVDSSGGKAASWGKAIKIASAAVVLAVAAVAIAAVGMAAQFDRSMRNVNSISKLPEAQFKALSAQVVDLSKRVPQSADTLAKGLYDIASSGFQGAEGLTILQASAKAASAGLSDTATAAQAIVGVINAYGQTAADAAHISDVLFQGVNVGVLTFADMAQGMGDVIGIGAAAKVSIEELTGAVAAITLAGVPAAEAFTSLNRVVLSFVKPTDAMVNLFKNLSEEQHNVNIATPLMAMQTLGLHGVMELLRKSTGGNVATLTELFGDIRAGRGAFALMANDGKNYATSMQAVTDATQVTGATQRAFEEQMKAVSAQWDVFKNKIDAAMITLGISLLPTVSAGMRGIESMTKASIDFVQTNLGAFMDGVVKSAQNLGSLFRGLGQDVAPVAKAFAVMAGAAIVTTLNTLGTVIASLTGFLNDNRAIVEVLVALYGIKLLGSIGRLISLGLDKLAGAAMGAAGGIDKLIGMGAGLGVMAGIAVAAMATLQWGFNESAGRAKRAAEATDTFTQALKDNSAQSMNEAMFKNIQDSGVLDYVNKLANGVANMATEVRSATPEFQTFARDALGVGANDLNAFNRAMDANRRSSDPFVKSLIAAHDAGILTNAELQSLIRGTQSLGNEFNAAKEKLQATKDVEQQLGITTADTTGKMDGTAGSASKLAEQMQTVAEQTKAADDAMRAMVDPEFAMVNAANSLATAQKNLTDLQNSGTATEQQLAEAHQKVAEGALDLNSAAIKMEGAIAAGTTSLDASHAMLESWVEQGLITQETADVMGRKFDEAAWKAAQLQGTNITITVTADDRAFNESMSHIRALANQGIQVNVPIGGNIAQRWGGVMSYAGGGIRAHVTNRQLVRYGEPSTGGEAYIPKRGDSVRSKKIIDVAASWYRMRTVPMATGGIVDTSIASTQAHSGTVASGKGVLQGSAVGNNILAAALAANDGDLAKAADTIDRELQSVAEAYAQVAEVAGQSAADQLAAANLTSAEFQDAAQKIIQGTHDQEQAQKQAAEDAKQAAEEEVRQAAKVAAEHVAIHDNEYKLGKLSTEEYLAMLRHRIQGLTEYSDEWTAIMQQIQDIENSTAQEHMRAHDIMFEVGDMGADQYLAILNKRLAGTEKYTQEWLDLTNQIKSINDKQAADQRSLEDRLHTHGLTSNQDYLKILNDRLGGAKENSQEWFDLVDQIEKAQQQIIDDSTTSIDELTGKINDLTGVLFGAFNAATQFYGGLQDLVDTVAKGGNSFDILTAAGRQNRDALAQAAQAAIADAEAVYGSTGDIGKAAQTLQHDLDSIRESLTAEGMDKAAVDDLLKQLGVSGTNLATVIAGMPGSTVPDATTAGTASQSMVDATKKGPGSIDMVVQRALTAPAQQVNNDYSQILNFQFHLGRATDILDPDMQRMVQKAAISTAKNVARGLAGVAP